MPRGECPRYDSLHIVTISFSPSSRGRPTPLAFARFAVGLAIAWLGVLLTACDPYPVVLPLERAGGTRDLGQGMVHQLTFELEEGASVRLVVEVLAGDVDATLEGPDGTILDRSAASGSLDEQVAVAAPSTGTYRLVLYDPTAEFGGARYRATLDDQRPPHPNNERRAAADRSFRDGYHRARSSSEEDRRAALLDYSAAEHAWIDVGDPCELAVTRNRLGLLHGELGEVDRARDRFKASLETWRDCPDKEGGPSVNERATLLNLANLERDAGRLNDAEILYQRLLDPLEEAAESRWSTSRARELAQGLRAQAVLLRRRGDLPAAREALHRALELSLAGAPWIDTARTFTELGTTRRVEGRTGQARGIYRRARGLAASDDSPAGQRLLAAIDNNLGVVDLLEGRYEEAVTSFTRALQFNRERGEGAPTAAALRNLAAAETRAGRPGRARDRLEEALEIYRRLDQRSGEVATAVTLAWLEVDGGDGAAVIAAADRLEGLLPADSEAPTLEAELEAAARGALGFARLRQERWTAAIEHFTVAVGQSRDRVRRAQLRLLLGEAHLRADRLEDARRWLRASEDDPAASLPALEATRLHLLALLARKKGDTTTARRLFSQALDRVEGLRDLLPSGELRATFFARRRTIYEDAVDLLVSLGTEDSLREAFQVSERAHARSLFDLLRERAPEVEAGLPTSDRERRGTLLRERRVLQARLWGEDQERLSDDTSIEDLLARLQQVESELAELDQELAERSPRYAALTRPTVPDLSAVFAALPPGTLLLEYLVGDDKAWLLAARPGSLEAFPLPGQGLAERIVEFGELLVNPSEDTVPYRVAAEALFEDLLGPVAEDLQDAERLLVVADGPLHRLPFEALLLPDGEASLDWSRLPYLLRQVPVTYAPSAAVLTTLGEGVEPEDDPRFVVFGPPAELPPELAPLPGAEQEATELATLHSAAGFETRVFLAAEATEEKLGQTQLVRPGDRLHIASHALPGGLGDSVEPLLLLASSPRADGRLELHELLELDLPAALVTLAACATQDGAPVRGEGLMGLGRGFLTAGTQRVLASLFPVHDRATHRLMLGFYGTLGDVSTGEALRAAKLTLLEEGYAHPYYWSPFVLVGDPH